MSLLPCRAAKSGAYKTLAEALKALDSIKATSDRKVVPQRAYPCDLGCRAWHLTSQPRRSILAKRRR